MLSGNISREVLAAKPSARVRGAGLRYQPALSAQLTLSLSRPGRYLIRREIERVHVAHFVVGPVPSARNADMLGH